MARGLGAWLGGSLLLCILIGAVYLPPRGVPKWAEGRIYRMPELNQQRARARELAGKWQEANATLLGAQYHDRVGPAVAERRGRNQPGPVLDLQADDSVRTWSQPIIERALDSAWKRLDLGLSKVSVGVLLRELRVSGDASDPKPEYNRFAASYLLPDSTDRSTCLVVASLPHFAYSRRHLPPDQLLNWGAGTLGPCAFYARFGVPSPRVERWLGARQFDVAFHPGWFRQPRSREGNYWMFGDEADRQWWWGALYSHTPETLGCLAGRPEACRRGIAAFDRAGAGGKPRVVLPFDPWNFNKVKLIGAQSFLSDLVREVGDERFQEFWTTALPVDSALTLALKQPVGEYTVSWLRRFTVAPRFGAGTTWLDAGLGLAFAALLVGVVLLGQGRREAR